jgi:hypothetical protein
LTVLAEGETREQCLADLRERAARIQRLLFGEVPSPAAGPDWYARLDDPEAV